ncbi:MAG: Spy/CpxP family protein refolding chaperone [Hyphomonadaceae bacterium]
MNRLTYFMRPIATAGVLIAACAFNANAQSGPREPGYLIEQLDLSEQQQSELQALREQSPRNQGAARQAREQVRELIRAGEVDQAAELVSKRSAERVRRRAQFRSELATILTPAQLQKLDALRADRDNERKGCRQCDHNQSD